MDIEFGAEYIYTSITYLMMNINICSTSFLYAELAAAVKCYNTVSNFANVN